MQGASHTASLSGFNAVLRIVYRKAQIAHSFFWFRGNSKLPGDLQVSSLEVVSTNAALVGSYGKETTEE